jgi:hypothetical protein
MTRFFPTILLSFFLCFQTSATADENNISSQITTEETESVSEDTYADSQQVEQQKEELSELEKEALAAEEAELRESGIYEEPIEE